MAEISINNLPLGAESKYLSKVKIGSDIYFLKDAEVRAIVATLKEGAFVDVLDGTIAAQTSENEGQLVTAKQVKDAIANLAGAMHFIGVKSSVPTEKGNAGDVILVGTKEYVADANGAWVELGDETEFVKKTFTIAGIDMQDAITADELAKALEETLVGDLKGVGTAQTIEGLTASGDIEGTAAITTTSATVTSTGKFTPAGNITGDAIKGGSISVTVKDAATATDASLTKADYTPAGNVTIAQSDAGVQISGTVSKPDVNVVPTMATLTYVTVTDAGTGYSLSNEGNATGTFASEGIKATVQEADEMLVFSDAGTASVQYTAPVLSGSLPTFNTENKLDVATGITSAGLAEAPVFTGDKFGATFSGTEVKNFQVTGVSYFKQEIDEQEFTPVATTLGFAGTEGNLEVSGNYDKVDESAEVTIEGASLAVDTINVAAQNVTISKK